MHSLAQRFLVQDWRVHRLQEERHLARLLRDLRVDCVFDVGANVGMYAKMLREYCGYTGYIVSFEPTPATFDRLVKNCSADRKWRGFNCGLGATSGTLTLHDNPGNSEGNSFLAWNSTSDRPTDSIEVEVKTLSSLFPALQAELGFRRPFLKMDTQGFDLQVFEGASEFHAAFVGLQSELALSPFYDGAPDWNESLSRYREAGFALSALIANNAFYPEIQEVDCVMLRPACFERPGAR